MLTINDIDKKDYKYIVDRPDSTFNPAKNKAIIDATIKETEQYFKSLQDVFDDNLMERIEAVGAYGRYRLNRGGKKIKDYLGDRIYTEIVGEKILSKLRVMESVNKLNQNHKYKNTILL